MMSTEQIVSDAEIDFVHGHANFGGMTKRGVVDEGVLKRAFGYHVGYTQRQILREHGLIRLRHPSGGDKLTAKGKTYLHALGPFVFDLMKGQFREKKLWVDTDIPTSRQTTGS